MTALVAIERDLWLNLSGIKDKDKNFLLDTPLSPAGLFGDSLIGFKKRKSSRRCSRNSSHSVHVSGTAGQDQSKPSTSSSHQVQQKQCRFSRSPTLHAAHSLSVPSGARSANPAFMPGHRLSQRALSRGTLTPSEEGQRAVKPVVPWQCAITGRCVCCSKYSRGQSCVTLTTDASLTGWRAIMSRGT